MRRTMRVRFAYKRHARLLHRLLRHGPRVRRGAGHQQVAVHLARNPGVPLIWPEAG